MVANSPKDGIISQRIIAKGGLNSANNYLELSLANPGSATRLVNFETSVYGGYRKINGYLEIDEEVDQENAEGPILGIAAFNDVIYVMRKNKLSDTYEFYSWSNPGWVKITTGATRDLSDGQAIVRRVRSEVFNFGDKDRIIFVDGVNPAIMFDGTNWIELTSSGDGTTTGGGDQIVNKPSVVTSFKNHIFLSGSHQYPNIVCHSAPNDAMNWTAAGGGGQITSGIDVLQIKPFRDELFVFSREKIKKIVVGNQDSPFLLNDVTNNIGCIARDSVLELAGSLIFLSPDGIRPIAGTARINDVEITSISGQIQSFIIDINNQYDPIFISGLVIRNKSQFRYFFDDGSIPVDESKGLLGSFRPTDSPWEYSELLGIRVSSCWSGYINGREIVLHGDYDGKVYQQEIGNSFNGRDITAIYTTPFLDFGDTRIRKVFHKLSTFVKLEGDIGISIGANYDWNFKNIQNPSNYFVEQSSTGNLYDDSFSLYDSVDTIYAIEPENVIFSNIQGSFFSAQITFVTSDTKPSYTILGHVLELAPQGRD